MPYLPPPKAQVKRVKGKCPSSTLRVFKAKLQTEIASKHFFQDGRTQPRVGCGDPYHRGHEKLPVRSSVVDGTVPWIPSFTSHLAMGLRVEVGGPLGKESDVEILDLSQPRVILSKLTSLHKCFLLCQKKKKTNLAY